MDNGQKQKVTIIIPYYNFMDYIEDCLKSVLLQSYSNLEVILINDSSDWENTSFIESLLTDPRIVYLKNEVRRGVGYSRNRGLRAATGDYVYFLDSDDYLVSDAIELLVNNIGASPAIMGSLKKFNKVSDLELPLKLTPIKVKKLPSRTLFKAGRIVNVLVNKEFIIENNVQFYEETDGFTEIKGILPFILHGKKLPKLNKIIYRRRIGNDPIINPRLVQRPIHEVTRNFAKMYVDLKAEFKEHPKAKRYLNRLFLNFYRKNVINIFRSTDPNSFNEAFTLMQSTVRELDFELTASQPMHIKKELKHLKLGNIKGFQWYLRFHIEGRDLRNALKNYRKLKTYFYRKLFQFASNLPTRKNLIMFESFLGKQYSDNPRAIYQYLKENHPEYKMYWSVDPHFKKGLHNEDVSYVKRFSIRWLFLMARARFWVTNSRMPLWMQKPKNTIYLQTWHGTPLKRLAQDQKEVLMPGTTTEKYKKNFYNESRNWDYLVSPNKYSSEIFMRAFQFHKTMVESGYPRNDVFYSSNRDEKVQTFRQKHRLPQEKKIILYAPTWRDNQYHQVGKYKMELQLDLKKLSEELAEEYIIILRMHYLVAENFDLTAYNGFAFDFSKHEDIQDLYLISDLLITDYSSVFFDYANLKRPMIFFTYDIEEYKGDLRGFYFNLEEEAPGPLVSTTEEVIKAIKNFSKENYSNDKLNQFYERFCFLEDGHASERVVKEVILNNS
ncbi:CDP-glycerol:glycerophosphate glycerophosphotransferase [Bacillus salipaludis]|uniref:bifunctional glycosyltransferase/CDP-glycerol:glycerophosphate glycerophosphotransferase n=1 Tax=Bacillus salipaludis TaxID=2547811 RepID=UPI002E218054|nr:CDP-glycerol:glycerophosphate glycerophosphotransferase [Bacillus salipaludis]